MQLRGFGAGRVAAAAKALGVIFGVTLATLPAAQARSSCFSPTEASAAHFRAMQLAMNVAALSCPDAANLDWHAEYAHFIADFTPSLAANAQTLKVHFGSPSVLDRWMTQVGNDLNARAHAQADYCQWAYNTLASSHSMSAEQMVQVSDQQALEDNRVNACAAKKPVVQAKAAKKPSKAVVKTVSDRG